MQGLVCKSCQDQKLPGKQTLVLWSPNVGPCDLTVLRQVLNDADGGLELFLTVRFRTFIFGTHLQPWGPTYGRLCKNEAVGEQFPGSSTPLPGTRLCKPLVHFPEGQTKLFRGLSEKPREVRSCD